MSCFVNGSLFTKVLPLCGCLTFLKANDSSGLQTRIVDLWTCAQCAGGPLHEVFLCTCIGSTCFVVITVVVAGVEGVVVLKEVSSCAICAIFIVCTVLGTVLGLYLYCFCHKSCRIWKMLDVPSDISVFILKIPFHYVLFWVIRKQYTHPKSSTIAEKIRAVIHICDYESVQVLFTPNSK